VQGCLCVVIQERFDTLQQVFNIDKNTPKIMLHVIDDNLLLMAKGEYETVHANAMALIRNNVDDPAPYLLLAKLCFEHENYVKARELFERSVSLAPDDIRVLTYFSQALTQLGEHGEASLFADRAASLGPSNAHIADTLGVVYSRLGFHEKAVLCFQQAVSLDVKPANYHYNLAASLQFLGDFEAAKTAYEQSLSRAPEFYRALASLVSLEKQSAEKNKIDALLASYQRWKKDSDAALYIGHALAKTYEDLGDYTTSFAWLKKAKLGKCATANTFSYERVFSAAQEPAISNCKADNALDTPSDKQASSPIFIVGLPRTGTTLVDRILSSHRDVVSGGELNTFAELVKRATNSGSNLVLDAQTLSHANTLKLHNVGEQYLEATNALRRNAIRFTDKMPLNFFYAKLILKALPNARIIVLRRGAMDSCLSNYRQLLTTQHSYYDYTYSLKTTAQFYRKFDQLMGHWRASLPSNRFMEVRYEDIVFNQQGTTEKLLKFCDLEWDDACLRFHENKAPVSTASSVQVRKPLYSGSIGRWKRYGDLLHELKDDLGDLAEDV
jgi:tetratricopeptide (TPR) repeat protein